VTYNTKFTPKNSSALSSFTQYLRTRLDEIRVKLFRFSQILLYSYGICDVCDSRSTFLYKNKVQW